MCTRLVSRSVYAKKSWPNRYCGDVLTQLAAAESAVRRVSEMLLAEHMRTCVVEEVRAGNDEVIDEVMALMRRFAK